MFAKKLLMLPSKTILILLTTSSSIRSWVFPIIMNYWMNGPTLDHSKEEEVREAYCYIVITNVAVSAWMT